MHLINDEQRAQLEACRIRTWDGGTISLSMTGWDVLMLVTDAAFPLVRLPVEAGSDDAGNRSPDIIIWPAETARKPDIVPISLQSVSAFDIEGDVARLFATNEPCSTWTLEALDAAGADPASGHVSRSWRKADHVIDLGDVLR